MKNNFQNKTLEDVVKRVKVGFVGSINEYYCSKSEGVPLIRTTDIDDIDSDDLKFVTYAFHVKNKKSQIKKGDLIIARHGSSGNAVVYDNDRPAQVLNAVIIEPDYSEISSKLLKLFFDSPFIKRQIKGSLKGSVQGVINTKHVSDLVLPFSDTIDYEFVEQCIDNLDSKIDINNRINAELETMAKLIYDYWFVQFDFPISAAYAASMGKPELEGKPYKSSGGKMVWNEELKRDIPEGWEVDTLSSWIDHDKSGDWGKESIEGNYTTEVSCIRGADINGLNGKGEVKAPLRFILEKNEHKILDSGDLIIEISGGSPTQSTGRMAFITEETLGRFENPLICSNFCKAVTLKEDDALFVFAFEWNRLYDAGVFFGWEGKTSGIKNFLFESFVSKHLSQIPPVELMQQFTEKVAPMHSMIQQNLRQNQKLAELRDWLLPMLMNGQVKVKTEKGYGEGDGELGMVAEGESNYKG